eukprot:6460106-Amphidinium_carterae.1
MSTRMNVANTAACSPVSSGNDQNFGGAIDLVSRGALDARILKTQAVRRSHKSGKPTTLASYMQKQKIF